MSDETLTQKEKEALIQYKEKWLDLFYNPSNHQQSLEVMEKATIELYQFVGLSVPKVIVAPSPYACQLLANIADDTSLDVLLTGTSREFTREEVDELAKKYLKDKSLSYYPTSNYGNASNFGWLSFYDYFIHEANVEFTQELLTAYHKMREASVCAFSSLQFEEVCIISRFPDELHLNNDGNMHSLDGPAIVFHDGYSQYYYNGIYVEKELFLRLIDKKVTFRQWAEERNEETKSLILSFYQEKFGGEFVSKFLADHLKEVGTFVDKKNSVYLQGTVPSMNIGVYTLFKGEVQNVEIAYVRCYCPSTDRMFFLGVDPEYNNPKDAIASLCRVPKVLKDHIVSIARQGEIFSFNFNEEGTNLLKDMKERASKEELQEILGDTVPLSGDEYFLKMKFEY